MKNYETPSGAIINCKDGVIDYNGSQMATVGENGKITFDKGTGIEVKFNTGTINETNINLTIIITAKGEKIKQIEMPDGSLEGGIVKEEILNFKKPNFKCFQMIEK